ncbi:MAG: hypothetical protein ACI9UK_000887 [Candidatus Krumholzibacteriia bacterium]
MPATREQTVIVEVLGNRDNESPFTLFWHTSDPDDPNPVDYYPAGRAFWNQKPVAGDLFFAVY